MDITSRALEIDQDGSGRVIEEGEVGAVSQATSNGFTGFWVDSGVAERTDLSPAIKLLLALVAGLARRHGSCNATSEYIRRCLSLGKSTVESGLATLEQKGLIERRTTKHMGWANRIILLGPSFPKKAAPSPRKSGAGHPKKPGNDTTVRSIKEDEEGVAKALPRPPQETKLVGAYSVSDRAGSYQPAVTPEHTRFLQEWSAQVVDIISVETRPTNLGRGRAGCCPIQPATERSAADPAFMGRALTAYPGSDDPLVFRQHMRRAASTKVLREALATNVTRGYARARFGVDELGADALTMAGKSRKMPELCRGFYDRPAPEAVTPEQLAAVTAADVDAVMGRLDPKRWTSPCWLPCLREIAARARRYGVAADDYLVCADLVQERYPEVPYLWVADSITRLELDQFLAAQNRGGAE